MEDEYISEDAVTTILSNPSAKVSVIVSRDFLWSVTYFQNAMFLLHADFCHVETTTISQHGIVMVIMQSAVKL